MLSNKIYKHFFLELSKYFFLVLFTFSTIVWAVQAVNFLDLIVEDGHAVSLYLNYSLLNIPKILTKFIPLSFLLALVLTILKFDSENELIILWTSGLNIDERNKVLNDFLKKTIDILISTTVIEVGIDFPNANVIVIENSNKFGLSQLHQLRGRVGRGVNQGKCILMFKNNLSENAKKRIKILKNTNRRKT